jgi:hypothetical protein
MWRNSEVDIKRKDAKREADPISDLDRLLDRELKEEVEERREFEGQDTRERDSSDQHSVSDRIRRSEQGL